MRRTTLVAVFVGTTVVALLAVWFIVSQKGDTPIEVADGSIKLEFKDKFRKDSDKKLMATKAKHKAQTIDVMDQNANVSFLSVDVTGREWTITSADKSVTVTKPAPAAGKDDEVSIEASSGLLLRDDDTKYHHDDLVHRFTPATLSVAGISTNITLFCPSGTCKVKIHLDDKPHP